MRPIDLTGRVDISKFQSTHPRGVRLRYIDKVIQGEKFQSTHPRGVRLYTLIGNERKSSFNPRTREGCDTEVNRPINDSISFNPRTREGCDVISLMYEIVPFVSIHAPARGATYLPNTRIAASLVSIHAPARGATPAPGNRVESATVSIHAPARGAT